MTNERDVVGEFALADAADASHEPFATYEAVNGNDVVCLMRKGGHGGYHEIVEGIVAAKKDVRFLHAFHVGPYNLAAVQPEYGEGNEPYDRAKIPFYGDGFAD